MTDVFELLGLIPGKSWRLLWCGNVLFRRTKFQHPAILLGPLYNGELGPVSNTFLERDCRENWKQQSFKNVVFIFTLSILLCFTVFSLILFVSVFCTWILADWLSIAGFVMPSGLFHRHTHTPRPVIHHSLKAYRVATLVSCQLPYSWQGFQFSPFSPDCTLQLWLSLLAPPPLSLSPSSCVMSCSFLLCLSWENEIM